MGLEHRTPTAVITLTELKSSTGEAHVWIVRGKRRCVPCAIDAIVCSLQLYLPCGVAVPNKFLTLQIMRSKWHCRAGFDLTLEVAWRAAMIGGSAAEASGTLSLANISPDELDELGDLIKVAVVERDEGISSDAEVTRPVKSIADKLQEQLSKLHQLLKER